MIKMKAKNISHIISYAMAVVLCSAGLSACESDDASLNEGTMVFELTENDTPVGGTQEFVFDTPRSYTIKAENVVSATMQGLKSMRSAAQVAAVRGKAVEEL